MLSFKIEKLGDLGIVHCAGRIVFPYASELPIPLLRQLQVSTLILDFLDIMTIDASGLGLLVSLRTWAKQTGRTFKLMNVAPRVEQLLQLTKLKSEFEICSAREMHDLLCRAMHQSVPAITVGWRFRCFAVDSTANVNGIGITERAFSGFLPSSTWTS